MFRTIELETVLIISVIILLFCSKAASGFALYLFGSAEGEGKAVNDSADASHTTFTEEPVGTHTPPISP
jgi:hypothetical protein